MHIGMYEQGLAQRYSELQLCAEISWSVMNAWRGGDFCSWVLITLVQ